MDHAPVTAIMFHRDFSFYSQPHVVHHLPGIHLNHQTGLDGVGQLVRGCDRLLLLACEHEESHREKPEADQGRPHVCPSYSDGLPITRIKKVGPLTGKERPLRYALWVGFREEAKLLNRADGLGIFGVRDDGPELGVEPGLAVKGHYNQVDLAGCALMYVYVYIRYGEEEDT